MAKTVFLSVFMLALISTGASAKDTRFWNLTANTITPCSFRRPARTSGAATRPTMIAITPSITTNA